MEKQKNWDGSGISVDSFVKGDEVYRKNDKEPFGKVSSIGSKNVMVTKYVYGEDGKLQSFNGKVVAMNPNKLWIEKNLHKKYEQGGKVEYKEAYLIEKDGKYLTNYGGKKYWFSDSKEIAHFFDDKSYAERMANSYEAKVVPELVKPSKYSEGGKIMEKKHITQKDWKVKYITLQGKTGAKTIRLGRMSDKTDVKNALKRMDLNIREVISIDEVFAEGGKIMSELQEEIKSIEARVKDPKITEEQREKFKKILATMKSKLESEKPKEEPKAKTEKSEPKKYEPTEEECLEIIKESEARKRKAKVSAKKSAQKSPVTKSKEKIEKVEKSVMERIKEGKATKAEIQKLIKEAQDLLNFLKKALSKLK